MMLLSEKSSKKMGSSDYPSLVVLQNIFLIVKKPGNKLNVNYLKMYKLYGTFLKHPYNKPTYTTVKMNEVEIHVSSWIKVQNNTLYCLCLCVGVIKT